jgi:hypothetical protein
MRAQKALLQPAGFYQHSTRLEDYFSKLILNYSVAQTLEPKPKKLKFKFLLKKITGLAN